MILVYRDQKEVMQSSTGAIATVFSVIGSVGTWSVHLAVPCTDLLPIATFIVAWGNVAIFQGTWVLKPRSWMDLRVALSMKEERRVRFAAGLLAIAENKMRSSHSVLDGTVPVDEDAIDSVFEIGEMWLDKNGVQPRHVD